MAEKPKPLKVYLDYNVIVNISKGLLTVDQLKKTIGTTNVVFLYSITHINEIRSIKDYQDNPRSQEVQKMLKLIDTICKKQYLERIRYDLPYKKRSVSASVVNDSFFHNAETIQQMINSMLSIQSEETKESYRSQLNLKTQELNNISPDEIIDHLNAKLLYSGERMTYLEMQRKGETYYPNGDFGIETDVVGLFVFLDLMGYWKDEVTDVSHVARLWDGSHCAYATFCDMLISSDKRMRMKSEVAYKLFGKSTKIISPEG